jgi:hypothetical protein
MDGQRRNQHGKSTAPSGGVRFRTRYLVVRGSSGGTSRKPSEISKSAELTGAAEKFEFSTVISMREASPDGGAEGVEAGAASWDEELCFLRPRPPKPPKRPERALATAAEALCCELFCVVFCGAGAGAAPSALPGVAAGRMLMTS